MRTFKNFEEYFSQFESNVIIILEQFRKQIQKSAPKAKESIKYGMPTFEYFGNLVHFAAYKNHIGFYPAPSAIKKFEADLTKYQTSKGAIQFPIGKLPLSLISKIVKFRVEENEQRFKSKNKPKVCVNGHTYYKTSDCKVCPKCEEQIKHGNFLDLISAPARRALISNGIKTLKQLSKYSEKDILKLHGVGASSIPKLRNLMNESGLDFRKEK